MNNIDWKYIIAAVVLIAILFVISIFIFPEWNGKWWLLLITVIVGVVGFLANLKQMAQGNLVSNNPQEIDRGNKKESKDRTEIKIDNNQPEVDLPRSVNFLEMFSLMEGRKIESIGDLDIAGKWRESMKVENQDWLRVPIAMVSNKEVRSLFFSAKTNGDGVHGLIAGATGTGKSELLLTLITALAVRYDPRIVNFVLVDCNGSAIFESIKKLPHCVDITTNLTGDALERTFIAINAEMERRSFLLATSGVKDLVDYRRRIIPRLKPDDILPATLPHLIVIVDEFTEIIVSNSKFKSYLESITRLGRPLGVSLILATKRPVGMISDQMRANMKWRICLRVDSPEESYEVLKHPEAASLPVIRGRGYLQVGNETLTELQVGWVGGEYVDTNSDPIYETNEILKNTYFFPPKLGDWMVGAMVFEAKRQQIPIQRKQWPDPLPEWLPLNQPIDATYLNSEEGETIVLNQPVANWIENTEEKPLWKPIDRLNGYSLITRIGLIDNPYKAEQRSLTIDVAGDSIMLFGSEGYGKTTFIKSLLISLAAAYSPGDLSIYALDFGGGDLKGIKHLPHIRGIVEASEEKRVERLMQMINNMIHKRQQKAQNYDTLIDYNTNFSDSNFPAIIIVLENISVFKETYDRYIPDLITLIRDGRSLGVFLIITATHVGDIPSRLLNLPVRRYTLSLPNASDYSMVVGRGWSTFMKVPGRGLLVDLIGAGPQPLEFQTAIPIMENDADPFRILAERMEKVWKKLEQEYPELKNKRPSTVEPLSKLIDLQSILSPLGHSNSIIAAPLGINDLDREVVLIEFQAKAPHWILVGPPLSGKTTAVRSLVLSLASCYSPDKVAMVFIDPSDTFRRFFNFGNSKENLLEKLPHVLKTVTNPHELDEVIKRLQAEYDEEVIERLRDKEEVFISQNNQTRAIFVIIDHYDEAMRLNKGSLGLGALSDVGKGKNIHFVISSSMQILSNSGDELWRRAESARHALVLKDYKVVENMGAHEEITNITKDLPPGRGFLVKGLNASLMQVAMPTIKSMEGLSPEERLDTFISSIRNKYILPAQWSYHSNDLEVLEAVLRGE